MWLFCSSRVIRNTTSQKGNNRFTRYTLWEGYWLIGFTMCIIRLFLTNHLLQSKRIFFKINIFYYYYKNKRSSPLNFLKCKWNINMKKLSRSGCFLHLEWFYFSLLLRAWIQNGSKKIVLLKIYHHENRTNLAASGSNMHNPSNSLHFHQREPGVRCLDIWLFFEGHFVVRVHKPIFFIELPSSQPSKLERRSRVIIHLVICLS